MADRAPERGQSSRPARAAAVAAAIAATALLAFGALQFLLPPALDSAAGLNHAGVRHHAQALLGAPLSPLTPVAFAWAFRLLLVLAWVAYALALVLALLGAAPRPRWSVPWIAGTALGLALLSPASLSTDVYAYVGFARLLTDHGLNPYLHSFADLAMRSDPIAAFCPAQVADTYGPVWTVASIAVIGLLRGAGLWWQVAGLKLLGAAAVVGAALSGRVIARRLAPETADLTLLAIGLNPLVLVEGAANGHNDLLMVALLLGGLACQEQRRPLTGYLLIGLSVGIKFVTAAIVPWLLLRYAADGPSRAVWHRVLLGLALTVAPTVVGYAPFWSGARTLKHVADVYRIQAGPATAGGPDLEADDELPASGAWAAGALLRAWPLLALYLALSVWVVRGPRSRRHLVAWVVFSGALPLVGMPIVFAWYFLWPTVVSLTRWSRLHIALTAATSFAAYVWQMGYVVGR